MSGHVVVTGGASGIGAATLGLLGRTGRVSVIDRTPVADAVWAAVPAAHRGEQVIADVADRDAMERAVARIARVPLDGGVANAGVVSAASGIEVSAGEWARVMAVNVTGSLNLCAAVARHLVARGRPGALVLVSSTAGLGYVAGLGAAYHASKAAVIGLTRSLAGELGPHRIRVNAVAPGLTRTPLTQNERDLFGEAYLGGRVPAGRLAESVEVAEAIVFLLSARSALLTGHVLPVDGGLAALAAAPAGGFCSPEVDFAARAREGGRE